MRDLRLTRDTRILIAVVPLLAITAWTLLGVSDLGVAAIVTAEWLTVTAVITRYYHQGN